MLKYSIAFSIALAVFGSPVLHAQTTEPPVEDTKVDPSLADIQLGQEVNDELPIGGSYIADQIGDWQVSCIRSGLEFDPCQMYQVLKDQAGNAVSEVSLFNLPEGSGEAVLGGTIVTPLETLLPAQITMRVDSANAKRYGFTLCAPVGCIARVGFTKAELDAFRRGNKATLTIVHALNPEQEIPLEMSLRGFTATYDAVVAANRLADDAARKAAAEAAPSGN